MTDDRDYLLAEISQSATLVAQAVRRRDLMLERARRHGIPLRDIANAAGIAPQTVLNITKRIQP